MGAVHLLRHARAAGAVLGRRGFQRRLRDGRQDGGRDLRAVHGRGVSGGAARRLARRPAHRSAACRAPGRIGHHPRQCPVGAVVDAARFLPGIGRRRHRRGIVEAQCERHRGGPVSGGRLAARLRIYRVLHRHQHRRIPGAAAHRLGAAVLRSARGIRGLLILHGHRRAAVPSDAASSGQCGRPQLPPARGPVPGPGSESPDRPPAAARAGRGNGCTGGRERALLHWSWRP